MKKLLPFIAFWLFVCPHLFAQYLVEWDLNQLDQVSVSETRLSISKTGPSISKTGPTIDKSAVKSGKTVVINFQKSDSLISAIEYKSSGGMAPLDNLNNRIQSSQIEISAKAQFENLIDKLDYPYEIKVTLKSGKTHVLKLGKKEDPMVVTLNLFKEWPAPTTAGSISPQAEKANAWIILDANSPVASRSKIFRRGWRCDTIKQARYLRHRDFVDIALLNFNPYKYTILLDAEQVDVTYGTNSPFNPPSDTSKKSTAEETSGIVSDNKDFTPLQLILKYAIAVDQIQGFINQVKDEPNPDGQLLEAQKKKLLENIEQEGLNNMPDISSLFAQLSDEDKKTYKEQYDKALQFGMKRSEVYALSYAVRLNKLPIRIRSFDKLVFKVTIKDKSGNLVEAQEYECLIIGGWQVNQSFGVAVNGLYDAKLGLQPVPSRDTSFAEINGIRIKVPDQSGNLVDSITSIQDVTKQKIFDESDKTQLSLGATTLTHLYYRLGGWSIGPELGLSVDFFPQTQTRYLVGGALMFMDGRFRVSLDAGYAFGKVSVLSNSQKIGQVLPPGTTSPLMVDKTWARPYVGLSWNIPIAPKDSQAATDAKK